MLDIKNKELEKYILLKVGKTKENLSIDDILMITSLNLNSVTLKNTFSPIYFEDLQYFRNLEELSISNSNIKEEDMAYIYTLSNLKNLSFYECSFDNLNGIENLDKLEILSISKVSYSNIDSLNKLSQLKYLDLISLDIESLDFLVPLKNLKHLDLSGSTIINSQAIIKLSSLDFLAVPQVKGLNIEQLLLLNNLKELVLSSDDIKVYQAKFEKTNIKIYDQNYIGDDVDV